MSAFPLSGSVPVTSRPNSRPSPSGNHAGAPSRRGSVVSRLISPDAMSSAYRSPGSDLAVRGVVVDATESWVIVTGVVMVVVVLALVAGIVGWAVTVVPVGGADDASGAVAQLVIADSIR